MLAQITRLIAMAIIVACVLVQSGCGSDRQIEQGAALAVRQVAGYRIQIRAKVEAENAYYDRSGDTLARALPDERVSAVTDMLNRRAEEFVLANSDPGADHLALSPGLREAVVKSVSDWVKDDEDTQKVYAGVAEDLQKNRQLLDVATAKLDQLESKLRILASPYSPSEMLRFLVAYGKEVKQDVDKLRQDAAKAQKSASAVGEAAPDAVAPKK